MTDDPFILAGAALVGRGRPCGAWARSSSPPSARCAATMPKRAAAADGRAGAAADRDLGALGEMRDMLAGAGEAGCVDVRRSARALGQRSARRSDLSQSMTATRQHTTDNLRKLNERLAVIDGAQKNITELATQVDLAAERAVEQAEPRRLRPGPHGGDHPGRPAEGQLRVPVHAVEPQPAGLRDLPARPAAAGDRREIPARSGERLPRRQDATRSASSRRRGCAPTSAGTSATSRRNT